MNAEPVGAATRRLAVVLAELGATPPPGVRREAFAAACRADTYEVLAGLDGVVSGIAASGGEAAGEYADLLWPDAVLVPAASVREVATWAEGSFDALVVVPADVPDLPPMVIAKLFRSLIRAEVCVAPERGGPGSAAVGVQLPWPTWLPADLGFDVDGYEDLVARAPDRRRLARGPGWHRLRAPASIERLDPGLEGWEQTRALLSGHPIDSAEPG